MDVLEVLLRKTRSRQLPPPPHSKPEEGKSETDVNHVELEGGGLCVPRRLEPHVEERAS